MPGIICAIRVGPASKSTLHKAIELAQTRQQPLHLLNVVNLDFLARTAHSRIAAIQTELYAARLHILLLRILADVNASRLALTADDSNSAYHYLKHTPDRLQELGNLLGSEHRQVVEAMQKRL